MRQSRYCIKGGKSKFGEKQKGGRTTQDAVSEKRIRSGTKLKINNTATSNTFEVDPGRSSTSKQKNKIGVTNRDDQKIYTICKLRPNGSEHGCSLSF